MARAPTDRTRLGPLARRLATLVDGNGAAWEPLAGAALLRRFARTLDTAVAALDGLAADAPAADRTRSALAEALVATRLLAHGCAIEHEVATPSGRRVDFRARRDGTTLDVHVKRAPQPTLRDRRVTIPPSFRALEEVARGVVATIAVARPLRGRTLALALEESRDFLLQASLGEELAIVDAERAVAVRLRIVAPAARATVELVPDLSASFDDHVPRFQATLRKAFAQFMPRSENIVVVCGSAGGIDPFATALLGSHIERWDRRPRAGELVAYGRAGDGFWSGARRNQSRLAAWWTLADDAEPLLFLREGLAARAGNGRAIALAREIFA